MAEGIVIEINAEDNSKKTLKDFAKNIEAANKEAAKAARSFKEVGQGARGVGDLIRAPGRAIQDFGKGLKEVSQGVEEVTTTLAVLPSQLLVIKDNFQELATSLGVLGLSFSKTRVPTLKFGAYMAGKFLKGIKDNAKQLHVLAKAAGAYGIALKGLAIGGLAIATKAVINYSNELAKLSEEVQLQSKFLEINEGALFGQAKAYERVTGNTGDFVRTLEQLSAAQAKALAGDSEAIKFFEQIGISVSTLNNLNADQIWELTKKAVDDATLSYKEAAKVLDEELVVAIDDVNNSINRFSDNEAKNAGVVQGTLDRVWGPWKDIWNDSSSAIGNATTELDIFLNRVSNESGQVLGFLNPINSALTLSKDLWGDINDEVSTFTEAFRGGSGPGTWFRGRMEGATVSETTNAVAAGEQAILLSVFQGMNAGSLLPPANTPLHRTDEVQDAFLQNQNEIWNAITGGLAQGSRIANTATTGGSSGAIDRSAEISAMAFARANEQGLERALRTAIGGEDFSLAREQAADLHAFRTTAAKQLDTEGEQFLAQQQADFALQDTLLDISSKEQQILADIREADMEAAKELLNARMELEKINKREEAQANADIAGANAFLISGSQFGEQYSEHQTHPTCLLYTSPSPRDS